ncbi:hypothetical protein [Microvirga arsenatis]|uniref:Uncharacterized protein n=1 Tax=Microvirga arsenatis TaxID=2692265 RepID=A0ABW9Z038_9HYPH|nr:hypothetical protein [Microvirga arsenatis]NBJ11435.1 hypothetical protein [Microvirga arsenatis]NBJ25708.1 hypothetical protein [Microvirga arsenatis]
MIGFVKHLVDIAGLSDNRATFTAPQQVSSPLKGMHIFPGTIVFEKA